jgi:hypothetical protein
MAARRRNEPLADGAGQQRAGGISRLPLWALQLHARSAVVRVNEDNAGRFEGALNRIDEVCPHLAPALEPPHRRGRHSGHAGEVGRAPPEKPPAQANTAPGQSEPWYLGRDGMIPQPARAAYLSPVEFEMQAGFA